MTLGERIKELRNKHGLSQEQLADKLNVSRQAVQKWESNINEPNIETLKCIACYFKVDYEYLLNGKAVERDLKEANEADTHLTLKENDNKNLVLYYILLVISVLLLIICFIWALIDKRTHPTLGEGFYVWYIPFYSSDAELIVFQLLNIVGFVGIIISLLKILNRKEK